LISIRAVKAGQRKCSVIGEDSVLGGGGDIATLLGNVLLKLGKNSSLVF
jgi:hypothetical protein